MAAADFAGSTAALQTTSSKSSPGKVVLLTECSMSDNVAQMRRTSTSSARAISART
jgi:quinolinate synthase